MRKRTFLVAAAVWCSAGALGWAQQPTKANPTEQRIDYQIGPGDLLQIFVWKEPDLTRDVSVRLDGRITVPLLGDVEAAGRSPQQLGEELAKSLARFLETPRVTVGVSQANSTRFYVVGLVGKPGDFPLSSRTTVLQGLALAGGFREFAKTENILIVRQEGTGQTVIPVNYKKLEDGKDISQNVLLRPGDTIVVP
jgi:polysaccharide biosynthesis/export protein